MMVNAENDSVVDDIMQKRKEINSSTNYLFFLIKYVLPRIPHFLLSLQRFSCVFNLWSKYNTSFLLEFAYPYHLLILYYFLIKMNLFQEQWLLKYLHKGFNRHYGIRKNSSDIVLLRLFWAYFSRAYSELMGPLGPKISEWILRD